MEFRQLAYLVAVLEHGSFTAGAAALHVSQPTLSVGLRSLERDLGVSLFERSGRRVEATEAAYDLGDRARALLLDTDAIRSHAEALSSRRAGRLDLVISLALLSTESVVEPLSVLRRTHPEIRVRLEENAEPSAAAYLVSTGQYEIGIADATPSADDLVVTEVGRTHVHLVRPPGSKKPRRPVTPTQLAKEPLISGGPQTRQRTFIEQHLATFGLAPRITVEVNHQGVRGQLVVFGAGSALMSEDLALHAQKRGAVVCELEPVIETPIVVFHRPLRLTPQATQFIDIITQHAAMRPTAR
jgi:LysR family carnitine catabolism transcriptional activator